MEDLEWTEKYHKIADDKAREWHNSTGLDKDDFYQIACLTILEARQTFDGGKGASEKTYLKAAIKKAFYEYVGKEFHHQYPEELSVELEDLHTSTPEEELIAKDIVDKLELSEDDRELLEMRNEGCTDEEIAEHQNTSRQTVNRRRKKIKRRIDDLLREN